MSSRRKIDDYQGSFNIAAGLTDLKQKCLSTLSDVSANDPIRYNALCKGFPLYSVGNIQPVLSKSGGGEDIGRNMVLGRFNPKEFP